ncbi:hypothetical protein GW17_00018456 [Ensete ventricosum]|nr:hypothetical protein GW17_00018456 [Ensete ventricosum]
MACFRLPTVAISPLPVSASSRRLARPRIRSLLKPSSCNARRFGSVAASTVQRFDWDDVVRIAEEAQEDDDPPSDLRGYFEKVRLCNRGSLYPVTSSYGMPVFFSLERAAAPYFGIKPYGISCKDNLLKECEEEAGIPRSVSNLYVNLSHL